MHHWPVRPNIQQPHYVIYVVLFLFLLVYNICEEDRNYGIQSAKAKRVLFYRKTNRIVFAGKNYHAFTNQSIPPTIFQTSCFKISLLPIYRDLQLFEKSSWVKQWDISRDALPPDTVA
jgi:hypothetical protein